MVAFLWENLFKGTSAEKAITGILQENILFQDLTLKQQKFVSNIIHLRKYHKNETIFKQGEIGVGMYIIISGAVTISVEQNRSTPDVDSDQIVITRLEAGDFFGELALVEESSRRSATAGATEATELIGFFKPDLIEIIERNPSAGVKITLRLAEVLGRRLRETNERVSTLEERLKQYKRE
jgi:CRP-like cAMP-binding protein